MVNVSGKQTAQQKPAIVERDEENTGTTKKNQNASMGKVIFDSMNKSQSASASVASVEKDKVPARDSEANPLFFGKGFFVPIPVLKPAHPTVPSIITETAEGNGGNNFPLSPGLEGDYEGLSDQQKNNAVQLAGLMKDNVSQVFFSDYSNLPDDWKQARAFEMDRAAVWLARNAPADDISAAKELLESGDLEFYQLATINRFSNIPGQGGTYNELTNKEFIDKCWFFWKQTDSEAPLRAARYADMSGITIDVTRKGDNNDGLPYWQGSVSTGDEGVAQDIAGLSAQELDERLKF